MLSGGPDVAGVLGDAGVLGAVVVGDRPTAPVGEADGELTGLLAEVGEGAVTVGDADDVGAAVEQAVSVRSTTSGALATTTRRQRRPGCGSMGLRLEAWTPAAEVLDDVSASRCTRLPLGGDHFS